MNSREIAIMREEELEQFTNFLNLSKTGFTAPLYFIQGTVGSGKTHLIERGMVKKIRNSAIFIRMSAHFDRKKLLMM